MRALPTATVTYKCHQRGCDHTISVEAQPDGRDDHRLHFRLTDEAEAELLAQSRAHFEHHLSHPCLRFMPGAFTCEHGYFVSI